jgi:D-beta-D-heptose 7-phosphate kinase/D-beta-D-heptose 1-phosphate adenosyltransferase
MLEYYNLNNKQNFIIIGDIILDINIDCNIQKIANEAPIIVFNESLIEYKLGGAGNVLANISSLGISNIFYLGIIGNDSNGQILKDLLKKYNTNLNYILECDTRPTTAKTRYYMNNDILFRCDKEITESISNNLEEIVINKFKNIIKQYKIDCVLFSDYNKGFITNNIATNIIKICNEYNINTFVDPKATYEKYSNCTLIKPNKSEAEKIFNININTLGLENTHEYINNITNCKWSLITLAENGLSLYNNIHMHVHVKPFEKLEVVDVTGAGDVVLSLISYLWNQISDKELLLQIINELARISVMHKGTYVITKDNINNVFNKLSINRRLVFTNGCFDIIHIGHLKLLEYCKKQGNYVIVGLNSDKSVKALKGDNRPINNEQKRKEFLETLPWIDKVIIFDEETPYELIKQVKPDILVKGGDYTINNMIGAEFAKELCIFPFIEGNSTTNIVNKISTIKEKQYTSWKNSNILKKGSDYFLMLDLDGTILDTDYVHFEAYRNALLEYSVDISWNNFETFINNSSIENMFKSFNLSEHYNDIKNKKLEYMLLNKNIKFIDGAEEFINNLIQNNINFVIVTNTSKKVVDHFKLILPTLNNIKNWITREDYNKPKPDPEPYKLALSRFYNNEKYIIGFENTINGYNSIKDIVDISYFITSDISFSYKSIKNENIYFIQNYKIFF